MAHVGFKPAQRRVNQYHNQKYDNFENVRAIGPHIFKIIVFLVDVWGIYSYHRVIFLI